MSDIIAIGARQEAKLAQSQARPEHVDLGETPPLVLAVVTAVAGELHSVSVLQDDGTAGAAYTNVRCIPAGVLAVDDIVWLYCPPGVGDGTAHPTIMNTGGSGSGSDNLINCGIIGEY